MSQMIKQSELLDVDLLVENTGGESVVLSYRYSPDSTTKRTPKYLRNGDTYLLIGDKGIVDKSTMYKRVKGKDHWKDTSDFTMVLHTDAVHRPNFIGADVGGKSNGK